jgi:predicted aminopeptidase
MDSEDAHVASADDRQQPRRRRRIRGSLVVGGITAVIAGLAAACSPLYVIKAGWEEAKILRARRPIPEVILDPETDESTRGKLTLAMEARDFAIESLGLDAGKSYTTYTQLDRDTLAMILSASHRDRFESRTWSYPIVGGFPYKGFFDLDDALDEQRKLEEEGLDTYLRPTAAFSTLGWFSDPLLSTVVRQDEVEVVETILHELSHNHLWVKNQARFNESFATFVGRVGATRFFCTRDGGGPDTVRCQRAQERWDDFLTFSVFLDGLIGDLRELYASERATEEKLAEREVIFDRELQRFRDEVQPSFKAFTFSSFADTPLNNATLLSRMAYYHRLPDFQAHLDAHGGDLAAAVASLAAGVGDVDDPFDLLPVS